jgi:hypothetical protein
MQKEISKWPRHYARAASQVLAKEQSAGAQMGLGSARVPRAISGVPPENLFGETPNTTRGDARAPRMSQRHQYLGNILGDL